MWKYISKNSECTLFASPRRLRASQTNLQGLGGAAAPQLTSPLLLLPEARPLGTSI